MTSQCWSHGSTGNHSDVSVGHTVANHVTSQCWSHGLVRMDLDQALTKRHIYYFVIKILFQVNYYFQLFL